MPGLGTDQVDVTTYQSVEFAARYDGGTFPTAGDYLQFQFLWWDSAGTQLLDVDTFEITSTAEPSGQFTGKSAFARSPIRGARLSVFSNSGSSGADLAYALWGSNRAVPRFTIRQDTTAFTATDNILRAGQLVPGASATGQIYVPVFSGSVYARMVSIGTATQQVRVQMLMGSPGQALYDFTHTINTTPEERLSLIFPRRPIRVSVQNLGASATNGIRYAFVAQEP